jgi:pyruvate formate lyase activating enzyme
MKEAYLYTKLENDKVQCELCYKNCLIRSGETGFCQVRQNIDGTLYAHNYGISTYFVRDTIETEGVFHYKPGCSTIEIGTYGCNLHCKFCQNWKYSQADKVDKNCFVKYTPDEVVQKCQNMGVKVIAWTFNDPAIWYEFVLDTAEKAKKQGIISLFKSSHTISLQALENLSEYVDIFSISLKSIDPQFYKTHCEGSIVPVLEGLEYLYSLNKGSSEQKHIEISNLIIPETNDSDEEITKLVQWIIDNMDTTVPLHFVRYHPDYLFEIPRTPAATVLKAREIAKKMGMKHVYVGNIFSSEGLNTYCHTCGSMLIKREGRKIDITENLDKSHLLCNKCKTPVDRLIL